MAVSRKFGVFEIDEGGGQVTLGSGKTLSADQVTEGTNKFVTAAQKANLDNIASKGRKNLWTDGALKYGTLERQTSTSLATLGYVTTLIQVVHALASGSRGNVVNSTEVLAAGTRDEVFNCLQIAVDGADSELDTNSYYKYRHYIYQGTRHFANGQKIQGSFNCNSSVAGKKIGVVLVQNFGSGGAPDTEIVIPGTLQTLASGDNQVTYNFTTNSNNGKTFGTNNDDYLAIDIYTQAGATVATDKFADSAFGYSEATVLKLDSFQTNVGEVAYDFVATDDKVEVLEFYKVISETAMSGGHYDGGYTRCRFTILLYMKKKPTMTVGSRSILESHSATNETANYDSGCNITSDRAYLYFARLGARPLPLSLYGTFIFDARY